MALTKVGVQVVAPGIRSTIRDLGQADTQLKKVTNTIKQADKASGQASISLARFQKQLSNIGKSRAGVDLRKLNFELGKVEKPLLNLGSLRGPTSSLTGQMKTLAPATQQATSAFSGLSSKLSMLPGMFGGVGSQISMLTSGMGGMVTVVGALGAAFVALGNRGLGIETSAQAFGNAISSLGDPNGVLDKLRKQTRGTVSDVELMNLSIKALQGTTTEFRQVVAPNLGKVFDVTARAARATGQSAEVVREKFLLGLRRQSKLLLDDIGVMVDAEKAYERYAEKIGVAASALSDQQKQAAFAAEAIAQLDRISQEAGGIGSLQELFQQTFTTLKNIVDQIAVALLPVFKPIAGAFMMLLQGIARLIQDVVVPIIKELSRIIGAVLTHQLKIAAKIIGAIFYPAIRILKPIITNLIAILSLLADMIEEAFKEAEKVIDETLGPIMKEVDKFFDGVEDQINDFFVGAAFVMGFGGAAIVGAFAKGLLMGAGPVIDAVTFIAQIVADFLQGFSPPKRGPLSRIDEGGANVIKAWADGMLGGIVRPMNEIASFVEGRLGAIGSFSREQVEKRLLQLDAALQPFRESLEIVKSDMQAIAGYVDPATRILERQRKAALEALREGRGEIGMVRALDERLYKLQEIENLKQDAIDRAELELAVAESQQAQERALLNIQKARLGEAEKLSITAEKAATSTGGAGEPVTEETGGAPFTPGEAPDITSDSLIDETKDRIRASFERGIQSGMEATDLEGTRAAFGDKMSGLNEQLGRISESEVGQNFKNKITGAFDDIFGDNGAIAKGLESFKLLFTDPGKFFKQGLSNAKQAIEDFKSDIFTAFNRIFGLSGFVGEFLNLFEVAIGNPAGTLQTALTAGGDAVFGEDGFAKKVKDAFDGLFGPMGSVSVLLTSLFDRMGAPTGVFQKTFEKAFEKVNEFKNNVVNRFNLMVSEGIDPFVTKLDTIKRVLQVLWPSVAGPLSLFQAGITSVFYTILGPIQSVVDKINEATDGISALSGAIPGTDGGGFGVTDVLKGAGGFGGAALSLFGPGSQAGTPWTGYGPLNRITGFHHSREAVVPHDGMRVDPSPEGLKLRGLTSMMATAFAGAYAQGMTQAAMVAPTYNTSNRTNTRSVNIDSVNYNLARPEDEIIARQQMKAWLS